MTFQEIRALYESNEHGDIHARAIKLPVPLVLEQNEFNLLHIQMWPDIHEKYASFDFAVVATIKESSTHLSIFEPKGYFMSLPGHDDFICVNDMTDEDNTDFISSLFESSITAYFFAQDGTLILRKIVYSLLKSYFYYAYSIDSSYKLCEYTNLAFHSIYLKSAYSREQKRVITARQNFVVEPIYTADSVNHDHRNYIIDDCDKLQDPEDRDVYVLKDCVHICPDCGRKYYYTEKYNNKCFHCYCITEDTKEVIRKEDAYYYQEEDKYFKDKLKLKKCPCCGHNFTEEGHTYMKNTVNITICNNCNQELDECLDYEDQHCNGIVGIISSYHKNNTKQHMYGLLENQSDTDFKGFGFELEVDKSNINGHYKSLYNNIVAHAIIDNTGLEKEEVFFETDGSLDNGFEIISQPHTIDAFYEKTDSWKKMLDILSDATFKSHNACTCGLHIHVSKTWFGSTERQQNFNIGKIYKFFDTYWTDLYKASRRDTCSTYYCSKNKTNIKCREENRYHKTESHAWQAQAQYDHVTRHDSESHHRALNNSNYGTFEIRLGRGTLNKASFFAWIDLVLTIIKNSSKGCNKLISARDWLKGIKPSTAMYLLKRNSFVDAIKILHNDVYMLYNDNTDMQD